MGRKRRANSGQGACLVSHGAAASDLRVVAQAMHDAMVTDVGPRLNAIKVPVTLLYPQDDRLLTATAAAAAAAKIYGDAGRRQSNDDCLQGRQGDSQAGRQARLNPLFGRVALRQ